MQSFFGLVTQSAQGWLRDESKQHLHRRPSYLLCGDYFGFHYGAIESEIWNQEMFGNRLDTRCTVGYPENYRVLLTGPDPVIIRVQTSQEITAYLKFKVEANKP